MIEFHKKQFESILDSDLNQSYLPESMKMILNQGMNGIRNYENMLKDIETRHALIMKDGV